MTSLPSVRPYAIPQCYCARVCLAGSCMGCRPPLFGGKFHRLLRLTLWILGVYYFFQYILGNKYPEPLNFSVYEVAIKISAVLSYCGLGLNYQVMYMTLVVSNKRMHERKSGKFFSSHFPLQKSPVWHPQAGLWVEASLWKKTEVRGGFFNSIQFFILPEKTLKHMYKHTYSVIHTIKIIHTFTVNKINNWSRDFEKKKALARKPI